MDIRHIAQIAHEANRAFCLTLGDTSHAPWAETPDDLQASIVKGIQTVRYAISKGIDPTPAYLHGKWMEDKARHGWSYGPEKDPINKLHPCMRPFSELPLEDQTKDLLFVAIARTLLTLDR